MKHTFRYLVILILVLSAFAAPLTALAAGTQENTTQRYIITLQPGTNNAFGSVAQALARRGNFRVAQSFNAIIKGFTALLTPSQVKMLGGLSPVVSIEEDEPIHATDQSIPTGIRRIGDTSNGTAKIDGGGDPLDIDIATLDTGVDVDNPDLNVVGGFNAMGVSPNGTPAPQECDGSTSSGSFDDDAGHGTHVAGTIAAKDDGYGVVGVAPGARIWAIKVFDQDGNGYVSNLICGMDWIAAHASTIDAVNFSGGWAGSNSVNCGAPAYQWVFNGSWWSYKRFEDTAHEAVCHLVNDLGIPMIVAAGNDGEDASTTLPAAYPEVISVGAIVDTDGQPGGNGSDFSGWGADDTRAAFSNYGPDVTIYAPGVNILSDWPLGNNKDGADGVSGLNTLSGTSMATPHVTGAVALYLLNHPGASPTEIKQALVANGEAGDWGSPYGNQPLLNVNNSAFSPPVPTHNVVVNSVTPATPAIDGQANNVAVKITNNGNSLESGVSVTLTDGTTEVGTQSPLTLAAGASQTLNFSWTPSGAGDHSLTATVTYNGGATADNSTTVNVEAATHLLSVDSITALSQPITGQAITVRVHITNAGNLPESDISVALTDNNSAVGTPQTVPGSLAPAAGADIDFSWTPSGDGNHTLEATADNGDTSPAIRSITINVTSIVHDVAVTSVSVPAQVTQGQSASVTVGVKNNGTETETIAVSLSSNPTNAAGNPAPKSVTLDPGKSTTVTFSWSAKSSTATGNYTLTGHASISPEEDATPSDNSLDGTNQIEVIDFWQALSNWWNSLFNR